MEAGIGLEKSKCQNYIESSIVMLGWQPYQVSDSTTGGARYGPRSALRSISMFLASQHPAVDLIHIYLASRDKFLCTFSGALIKSCGTE